MSASTHAEIIGFAENDAVPSRPQDMQPLLQREDSADITVQRKLDISDVVPMNFVIMGERSKYYNGNQRSEKQEKFWTAEKDYYGRMVFTAKGDEYQASVLVLHAPRIAVVAQGQYEQSKQDDRKSLYTDTTIAVVQATDRRFRTYMRPIILGGLEIIDKPPFRRVLVGRLTITRVSEQKSGGLFRPGRIRGQGMAVRHGIFGPKNAYQYTPKPMLESELRRRHYTKPFWRDGLQTHVKTGEITDAAWERGGTFGLKKSLDRTFAPRWVHWEESLVCGVYEKSLQKGKDIWGT
ncbi:hypothetical protein EV421DRAFT_1740014 [Armillaria borealis]|uniref:Uncharacterized protein n=1 Tax=Armillaria borealis TaxID=47425 RepID=A0AA39MI61_9AGAR|nr:hypothetical protein EV421DRAFT_1740014 [Armillaria borealis]